MTSLLLSHILYFPIVSYYRTPPILGLFHYLKSCSPDMDNRGSIVHCYFHNWHMREFKILIYVMIYTFLSFYTHWHTGKVSSYDSTA